METEEPALVANTPSRRPSLGNAKGAAEGVKRKRRIAATARSVQFAGSESECYNGSAFINRVRRLVRQRHL